MKKIVLLFIISAIPSYIISMIEPMSEAMGNEKELFKAIEKNDIVKVQHLVNNGMNVTIKRFYKKNKVSPITFAIAQGNEEIINILISSLDVSPRNVRLSFQRHSKSKY